MFNSTSNRSDDDLYFEILEKNMVSMLYCLRSKPVCVDIGRMFLKSSQLVETYKTQLLAIDKISRNQTKKPIFAELYPNTTD